MKFVVCLFLLIVCLPSSAGNRGYSVIFFDASKTQEAKSLFKTYRSSRDQKTISNCWSRRRGAWISVAYVNRIPEWFSDQLASGVLRKDPDSVSALALNLSLHRDDLIVSGFDGAFIAARHSRGWRLIGVSRDGDVRDSEVDANLDIDTLDRALCKTGAAFDRAFVP